MDLPPPQPAVEIHQSFNEGTNPFLCASSIPLYGWIKANHVEPAISHMLSEGRKDIKRIETATTLSWNDVYLPIERILDRRAKTVVAIEHLLNVNDSEDLRAVWKVAQPLVIDFELELQQNQVVYKKLKEMREKADILGLDDAQKRILDIRLLKAKLAGIELDSAARAEFNKISKELGNLDFKFRENLSDALKAFTLTIHDRQEMAGMPNFLLEMASASYVKNHPGSLSTVEEGPWDLTLDPTVYSPVMMHAKSRHVREAMYRAMNAVASEGDKNNLPILERELALREKAAQLLGYNNHAEVSLASKMVKSKSEIYAFLDQVQEAAKLKGVKELAEIKALAREMGQTEPLAHWDIAYYSERLREKTFNYTEEELKQYFQYPIVLQGLFDLAHKLFGITIREGSKVSVWDASVAYYNIFNEQGAHIASFYIDPYSRPENKRGGAWMDVCLDKFEAPGISQLPVAQICCNGTKPSGGLPSLMSLREMETLFHEFGHAIQHMLTKVNYLSSAGINNVEWDAVELPSQFMENWCFDKATMKAISSHVHTGEKIPDVLFDKMVASRTFLGGLCALAQIRNTKIDLELHSSYHPGGKETAIDVMKRVTAETSLMPLFDKDFFICRFAHIFAGEYSAGYYSYLWADVLSADAFGAFVQAGLDNAEKMAEMGRKFRDTILGLGGSEHPMTVFKKFRGREPTIDALLIQKGLKEQINN